MLCDTLMSDTDEISQICYVAFLTFFLSTVAVVISLRLVQCIWCMV